MMARKYKTIHGECFLLIGALNQVVAMKSSKTLAEPLASWEWWLDVLPKTVNMVEYEINLLTGFICQHELKDIKRHLLGLINY